MTRPGLTVYNRSNEDLTALSTQLKCRISQVALLAEQPLPKQLVQTGHGESTDGLGTDITNKMSDQKPV